MSFATGKKKRGNPAFVKGAHPTGRSAGTPNKASRAFKVRSSTPLNIALIQAMAQKDICST
jgi:hypothetical protein